MEDKNKATKLIQGYHHHLKFINGFQVYGWTENKLTRKEAIKELLSIANSGHIIYDQQDIVSYWTTKK